MELKSIKAAIITIGDELLIGQVIDTNSAWMGQELNKIGISIIRKLAIGDEKDEIKNALEETLKIADIILITGGLGPTKDDITKHTLNEFFGGTLVTDKEVLNDVTTFFTRLNRPIIESNLQQAEVPNVCKPIRNSVGTAPGMWFEKDNKVIVSMPGVPHEMKMMMTKDVLPALQKFFKAPFIFHQTIMTAGIGESFLADKIKDWENNLLPNMKLAYLPNLSQVRLRISATGMDDKTLKQEVQQQVNTLLPLIDEFVFSLEDISLEQRIGQLLLEQNKTVATAESCTGGYIAHKITSIPGSSQWYRGSIIAYSYDIKVTELGVDENVLKNQGAVSEEVVKQMALSVVCKLKTDYGIAVSGIAGPDGGTPGKPVGLVWLALASGDKVITRKLQFARSRMQNIEMTAVSALDLLRKVLTGKVTL